MSETPSHRRRDARRCSPISAGWRRRCLQPSRLGPTERGRSINLALSVRGIHALREIGLADEVLKQSVLMRGRMIHGRDGSLTFQPYGKDDTEALNSVSRASLNRLLIEAAARYDSVRLFFDHKCRGGLIRGIEFANAKHTPRNNRRDGWRVLGRSSALRNTKASITAQYLTHGYKELTIPAGQRFLAYRKHADIWPRGGFMMIALPNLDGSSPSRCWPFEGPTASR
jgi:kynurenine 3-monooxygenase